MNLKQLTPIAKRLYKTGKFARYSDAVKAASKLAGKTKKTVPVKTKKRKVTGVKTASKSHTDKNRITANIQFGKVGSIGLNDVGSELFSLEVKIQKLKAQKKAQRLMADKKRIQSEISILQKQFRTLKAYLNSRAKFK